MNGLKTDIIINRDALFALRELPDESVNCCVTSPPYYALRDYGLDMQFPHTAAIGGNDHLTQNKALGYKCRYSFVIG